MRHPRHPAEAPQVDVWRLDDEALPGDIVDGFLQLEADNLEFGLDWIRNLVATAMPAGADYRIYAARDNAGGLVALPLCVLGDEGRAKALGNWYTSLYSPLVSSNRPGPLFAAIFAELANVGTASLTLSPLAEDAPSRPGIHEGLLAAGWRGTHEWTCFTNWFQDMGPGGYPGYLQDRPSLLRNTIRRSTRKFTDGGRGALSVVTGGDELEEALQAYTEIYDKSWKRNEPSEAFIPALARLAAARGWLRLGLAVYDNQPVAAQLWFVANGTASIFKLAYDPAFRTMSPGTVLTAHLMEHVVDVDRVNRVDYLTGDDAYKRDWMDSSRRRIGIAAFNPRCWRGASRFAVHGAKALARSIGGRVHSRGAE